jgi:hypothetical protein
MSKNGHIPPLPQYAFMASCSVKKKLRDNFTFTLKILQNSYVGVKLGLSPSGKNID